jgi:two-component system, LytTR family, response regulator
MENSIKINKKVSIPFQDIIYLRGSGNYTTYYMKDGKYHLVAKTMKIIEARLKASNIFYRTHKAFLINLNHIIDYQDDFVLLTDNCIAGLSRRKREGLITITNN